MTSRRIAQSLVKGKWYADIANTESSRVSFLKYSHSNDTTLYFSEQTKNGEYLTGLSGFITFYISVSKFYEMTELDELVHGISNKVVVNPFEEKYNSLLAEFEQYKRESVKWSVEDFTDYPRFEISKEKAQEALEEMISKHNAGLGITWNTIEIFLEEYGRRIQD
jgi:hypothetical protein